MFALNKPFAIHLLVGKDEGTWGIAILHNICKVLTSQSNGISQKFGWPQGQADPLASAARSSRDKFPRRSRNLQCNFFSGHPNTQARKEGIRSVNLQVPQQLACQKHPPQSSPAYLCEPQTFPSSAEPIGYSRASLQAARLAAKISPGHQHKQHR